MKLYLVRHGQSHGNTMKIHQPEDSVLTQRGKRQIALFVRSIKRQNVDAIMTSDYPRALVSAQIISSHLQKTVIIEPLLREKRSPKELIGRAYDIPKAFKTNQHMNEKKYETNWHYDDEENYFDLYIRAKKVVAYLMQMQKKNILIISHEWILQMIFFACIFGNGLTAKQYYELTNIFRIKNAAYSIIEKDNRGKWVLKTWNNYSHLVTS